MKKQTKAYIALVFVCIVWGTTYLALRIGALHFPAFLFAAIRQSVAGAAIMLFGFMMNKKLDLTKENLLHQSLVGFLLITIGNGFVTWGERYVPSGIAALICSLMPICAVIVNLIISKKERLNAGIAGGMLLGFGGVGLIFKDNLAEFANPDHLLGMAGIFVATFSWAAGSVINKKRISVINPVFNAGLQLFAGGVFLFAGSPLIDDYSTMSFWTPDVLWPMVYLIIFGSILAYTAYMFALKELPVGIVTLYAYVNPLVAVMLGYFILSEPLTWYTALAFITIMTGVYLVNRGYRKQHKANEVAPSDNIIKRASSTAKINSK